jgi:hypothetical protein
LVVGEEERTNGVSVTTIGTTDGKHLRSARVEVEEDWRRTGLKSDSENLRV